jgi:LPS export ABC transporter protein LptC
VAGCSLDYRAAELEEKASENIPDMVAIGLVHKIHKGGHLSMELEAERAESYSARKETIISEARFIEYDTKGGKATEGSARQLVFHNETENAEISGRVRVHSTSEEAGVAAESFAWQNKEKRLTAPADETVIIRKDDGSYLSGKGFVGDFKTRKLTFSGPVEGRYVWEEKEEKSE